DHTPVPGDASDERGSEPDLTDAAEFAKMQAVMRASEKHREGGGDPDLATPDVGPGPPPARGSPPCVGWRRPRACSRPQSPRCSPPSAASPGCPSRPPACVRGG